MVKKQLIFILILLSLMFSVNSAIIINQSSGSSDLDIGASAVTWRGQTFNYSENFNISSIGLNISKFGTPTSDLNLFIRATALEVNTGSNFCNVTLTSAQITTGVNWFYLSGCPQFNATTRYSLGVSPSSASGSNYYFIKYSTTNVFSSGNLTTSANSGSTWSIVANTDMQFYINSSVASAPTPNLTFTNISLVNNTYFNTTSIQINTSVLNTSTNGNINQTYYLYYNNGTLINTT